MKIIFLAMVIGILAGCIAPSPYEQKIEGTVFRDGNGVRDVKVRFHSSTHPDTCEATGLEATTDQYGKFAFSQVYKPSKFERIDVVIHPYRLCVFIDDRWQTAWSLTTGPAPHNVTFKCYLDGANKKVEKCLVSWDKQEFR